MATVTHEEYATAMRRKAVILERAIGEPKREQVKMLAEADRLTKIIRAFYAQG